MRKKRLASLELAQASKQKKAALEEIYPRPPCSACGEPATCEVELRVAALTLEGGSSPYWTSDYHHVTTRFETLLCRGCVEARVRTTVNVEAAIVKKKGAP